MSEEFDIAKAWEEYRFMGYVLGVDPSYATSVELDAADELLDSMQHLLDSLDDDALIDVMSDTFNFGSSPIEFSTEWRKDTPKARLEAYDYMVTLINGLPYIDQARAVTIYKKMLSSPDIPIKSAQFAAMALKNFAETNIQASMPLWGLAIYHRHPEVSRAAIKAYDDVLDPEFCTISPSDAERLKVIAEQFEDKQLHRNHDFSA